MDDLGFLHSCTHPINRTLIQNFSPRFILSDYTHTLLVFSVSTPARFASALLPSYPQSQMSSNREAIERALFVGRWDEGIPTDSSTDVPIEKLARDVIDGSFRSVLTSNHVQRILRTKTTLENLDGPVNSWFDFDSVGQEDRSGLLPLIAGIACLHSYVRPNYTGPDLDVKPLEVFKFPPNLDVTEELLHQRATTELAYGGEPAYHLAQVSIFLVVAEALWSVAENTKTVAWWRLRTWLLREQLLDEPVGLHQGILDMCASFHLRYYPRLSFVGSL